jgi:hypothetical protein
MEEEKEKQETTQEEKQEDINPLDESAKIVEAMEKANEEKKKLIEREEKLIARKETLNALGGGSIAGQQDKKQTPEDKLKEETKNFWKGTDIEKAIEKHG